MNSINFPIELLKVLRQSKSDTIRGKKKSFFFQSSLTILRFPTHRVSVHLRDILSAGKKKFNQLNFSQDKKLNFLPLPFFLPTSHQN